MHEKNHDPNLLSTAPSVLCVIPKYIWTTKSTKWDM